MKRAAILLTLLAILAAASLTMAQRDGIHSLDWWTVDSGGGVSGNGRYTLQMTMAQPDAGTMGHGRYTLLSGYWDGARDYDIYLPVISRHEQAVQRQLAAVKGD